MRPPEQDMNEATRRLRVEPLADKPDDGLPEEKRGSWYLLTGLILGLVLGLVYAWVLNPVVYQDTAPASLAEPYQDRYRSMIAQAYEATGSLERAISRLALLEDLDPVYALGVQAQQALADGQPEEAHALALLASALQGPIGVEPIPTATLPPIPTRTMPINTPTP